MKTCPTCNVPFTELKPVPSVVDDANGWFKAVDTDGNGTLDKEEAFAALASSLPAAPGTLNKDSEEALKNKVDEKWKQWDSDGDGKITCDENMTAVTGLRDFVLDKLKEAAPRPGSVYAVEPPQLPLELTCRVSPAEYQDYQDQKKAWFQHWDKDKSDSLDREEIVRAIVKTFNMSSASGYSDALLLCRLQSIREHLEVVWNLDAKGEDVIKLEDFLIPRDGLGDSIIASVKAWTDRS
jgi:Ca2+-binding EF-hand superfamily protein